MQLSKASSPRGPHKALTSRMKISMFRNIRKLILKGWTYGTLARDEMGLPVVPTSKEAKCWCLKGAVIRTAKDYSIFVWRRRDEVTEFGLICEQARLPEVLGEYFERWMVYLLEFKLGTSISNWNDSRGVNSRQVVALIDEILADLNPSTGEEVDLNNLNDDGEL